MNIFTLYNATLSPQAKSIFSIDLINDVKRAAFEIGTNLRILILIIQNSNIQTPIASQHPQSSIVYCTTAPPHMTPNKTHEYAQVLLEDPNFISVYSNSDLTNVCFCYLNEDYVSKNALKQIERVQPKPILLYEGANPDVADLIDGCTEWVHIRLAPPDYD